VNFTAYITVIYLNTSPVTCIIYPSTFPQSARPVHCTVL